MSQQEFETYLSVLSRLLRLKPHQREQIAEELRDHLEMRLEELTGQGVPREEAIRLALDEFGDAAGVANSFFTVAKEQRRRWMMRAMTISLGTAAAVLFVAVAFWPETQRGPQPRRAMAQAPRSSTGSLRGPDQKEAPAVRKPTELEEKLSKRISVEFAETPLRDVLNFLADITSIQFYVNERALTEVGLALDAPISLKLKEVRTDTVIDLTLEQLGGSVVGYAERDGVLIISEAGSLADRLEVQVYNCRDLLALEIGKSGEMPGMMAPGMPGGAGGGPMGGGAPAGPMMGGGGMGGMGSGFGAVSGFGSQHDARASHLMQLVTQIVKPESWSEAGGPGSIAEYGGLLVVRQNPKVHREVEKLLTMLRDQAGAKSATADASPMVPPPTVRRDNP